MGVHEPSANQKILFCTPIDSRPSQSPGLAFNLSSNNPFRNRAASPAPTGPPSPFDPPQRPVSRNPFLDAPPTNSYPQPPVGSADKMPFAVDTKAPTPALTGSAAELFVRCCALSPDDQAVFHNSRSSALRRNEATKRIARLTVVCRIISPLTINPRPAAECDDPLSRNRETGHFRRTHRQHARKMCPPGGRLDIGRHGHRRKPCVLAE